VEHVLIRNEFTGATYKFACGRWLGSGQDDGSCERYMVGQQVCSSAVPSQQPAASAQLVAQCASPPSQPLPPTSLKAGAADPEAQVVELQTMLGDAINRIVKFHHKNLFEKISWAHLMCGERGLVHALLNVFSFGYKSVRLFGRNLSVWDFFLKVTMDFNQSIAGYLAANVSASNSPMGSPVRQRNVSTLENPRRRNASLSNLLDSPKRTPPPGASVNRPGEAPPTPSRAMTPQGTLSRANQFRRMYTKLITRIETTCQRLGKDDKFQLFLCLAAHDRLLGSIVTDLTRAIAAQQVNKTIYIYR